MLRDCLRKRNVSKTQDDGIPDVAVATSAGVDILQGNGSSGFGAPSTYFTGESSTDVAVANLNGDGKPDLLVSSRARS